MHDLPCLCATDYRCNQCRARDWHAKREPARRRMRDNKLAALAKDFVDIDDDLWTVLLYQNGEQDDLDLLLFQGETS